jgi:hypothetical protein
MNIRRAFLALGAMILGVGFFGASPAFAVISCAEAPKTITEWPYNGSVNPVQYCGTATSAAGEDVADALHGVHPTSYGQLENTAIFYVFKDKGEFQTYWNEQNPNPPQGVVVPNPGDRSPAFTNNLQSTGAPQYTIIFMRVKDADGNWMNNPDIQNATIHEAGHWLDYLWRAKTGSSKISSSALFQNNFQRDVDLLNAIAPCAAGNLFKGDKDFEEDYICAGANGAGPGLNAKYAAATDNLDVLDKAWPHFGFKEAKEAFAEQTAIDDGNADQGGQESISQHYVSWGCTLAIVKSLNRFGELPGVNGSPYNFPAGRMCPTS